MIAQESFGATEMIPRVPSGYRDTKPEVTTGNGMGRLREALRTAPTAAPLWAVQSHTRSISLKRPILVRVYSEGEFVFAENESLSVCGTGSSQEEAMADFFLHLFHFYDYYRKLSPSKVIGDGMRLKQLFADLCVEK